jgi:hypothetical protein
MSAAEGKTESARELADRREGKVVAQQTVGIVAAAAAHVSVSISLHDRIIATVDRLTAEADQGELAEAAGQDDGGRG